MFVGRRVAAGDREGFSCVGGLRSETTFSLRMIRFGDPAPPCWLPDWSNGVMEWVLFDYGEVITRPPSAEVGELFAAELGVPAERFWPAYWHGRERYDRSAMDAAGYWRDVADQLDIPAPAGLDRLVELDLRTWSDIDPDALELLEELAADTALAMLSNAPLELADWVDEAPWASLFRRRFFSARLGRTKPDPRIFERVCELLGTAPADVLFVDDREVNVVAAAALGMRAVRYTSIDRLRADLRS